MNKMRSVNKIFVGRREGKRTFGKPRLDGKAIKRVLRYIC
jgi:hypothetical protein